MHIVCSPSASNSAASFRRTGTLMPTKTSPSPYSPGPVLKNLCKTIAAFLSASFRSLRLIVETGMKFRVLPVRHERPTAMSYENRNESACKRNKSSCDHAFHQRDNCRSNHNHGEADSGKGRERGTNS